MGEMEEDRTIPLLARARMIPGAVSQPKDWTALGGRRGIL